MSNEFSEVKRLAEALPVSEWGAARANAGPRGWEVKVGIEQIAADLTEPRAKFIAAANPQTALAMITEIDRLESYLCACEDCGGEGEIFTGNTSYEGQWQPPEPIMEKCCACDGKGRIGDRHELHAVIEERELLKAERDARMRQNEIAVDLGYSLQREVDALRAEVGRLTAENEALKIPPSDPVAWAAIRNGKVHSIHSVKPTHPGKDGWSYWAERGFTEPMPLRLGLSELSKAMLAGMMERARQVAAEGWTRERDDEYVNGQMARAAACYAMSAAGLGDLYVRKYWPWDRALFKPSEPYRDLEKSFALTLAEMERRDRAALESTG